MYKEKEVRLVPTKNKTNLYEVYETFGCQKVNSHIKYSDDEAVLDGIVNRNQQVPFITGLHYKFQYMVLVSNDKNEQIDEGEYVLFGHTILYLEHFEGDNHAVLRNPETDEIELHKVSELTLIIGISDNEEYDISEIPTEFIEEFVAKDEKGEKVTKVFVDYDGDLPKTGFCDDTLYLREKQENFTREELIAKIHEALQAVGSEIKIGVSDNELYYHSTDLDDWITQHV